MNRLVPILQNVPGFISDLPSYTEPIPFFWLAEQIGDKLFSGDELAGIQENLETMDALGNAFFPVWPTEAWRQAQYGWQVDESLRESEWFTMFLTDETGQQGITVPQTTGISDFVGAWSGDPLNAQLVVIDPLKRALIHFSPTHCGPPSWDKCSPGKCGNRCELTTLSDAKWGEVKTCRCLHGK